MKTFIILFLSFALFAGTSAAAETGVGDKEILIGTTLNQGGPNNSRALGTQRGAQIYFDKINAGGGVNGRTIRWIVYDDKYLPETAVENGTKLVEQDKVFAVFEPYGTGTTKALIPLINKSNIPFLFPFTPSNFMRAPLNKNIFNVRPGSRETAREVIDFAVDSLKKKNIAIINQDDNFGIDGRSGIYKALADKNLKLSAESAVPTKGFKDIGAQIDAAMKGQPDALVIWALSGAKIIKAVVAKGYNPIFLCDSSCVGDSFANDMKDVKATIYVFQGMPLLSDPGYPVLQSYLKDAKAAGQQPEVTGIDGYVNAMVFVEALKRTGRDVTRDKFRATLESINNLDLGGLKLSFGPDNHQGLNKVFVVKFVDGQFVPVR